MKFLFDYPALLLAASFTCAAARVVALATGPFLTQLDNQTWVIGNEIWNMTQQVTYGVNLYYQDHDCVNDAVGHYVSYSKSLRACPQLCDPPSPSSALQQPEMPGQMES